MRFRDGMWLVRDDFKLEFAEDIRKIDINEENSSISLLCPTKKILTRGDTLDRATVTIVPLPTRVHSFFPNILQDLKAEAEDIISVTATHWKGTVQKGPNYPLFPSGSTSAQTSITQTPTGSTTLTSGSLSLSLPSEPHTFSLHFHDTKTQTPLTTFDTRSIGFAYTPPFTNTSQLRHRDHAGPAIIPTTSDPTSASALADTADIQASRASTPRAEDKVGDGHT